MTHAHRQWCGTDCGVGVEDNGGLGRGGKRGKNWDNYNTINKNIFLNVFKLIYSKNYLPKQCFLNSKYTCNRPNHLILKL